jgi:hypothetical protein
MKSAASAVSGIAASQWGLLTTAHAEAAGVSRSSLARMCDRGDLERVGQGVYVLAGADDALTPLRAAWLSLAPPLTPEERLAQLPGLAVVSHASAAALHRLGDLPHDLTEFIVPELRRTIRPGVRLYQAHLEATDVTIAEGLPVTIIERTIADLLGSRRHGDPEHIARIVGDALVEARLDVDRLAVLLDPLASRYKHPDGEAVVDWLVELSGNGPTALAAKLSATALGRQVVGLALQNAFPVDTNSTLKALIATLADWLAAHPGVEKDVEVASRAALADRHVAEAMAAVRALSPEVLRAVETARRDASTPSAQRSIRGARQAWSKLDPAVVQAITSLGGRR